MLGDLGGVFEVIMVFFGFIISPVSEHSFFLKSIKKLYYARTKDRKLFKEFKPKNEDKSAQRRQSVLSDKLYDYKK
jgi:hypothetical protein